MSLENKNNKSKFAEKKKKKYLKNVTREKDRE